MHERAAYLIITFMGSPPGCPDPAWTSTGVEVGTAVTGARFLAAFTESANTSAGSPCPVTTASGVEDNPTWHEELADTSLASPRLVTTARGGLMYLPRPDDAGKASLGRPDPVTSALDVALRSSRCPPSPEIWLTWEVPAVLVTEPLQVGLVSWFPRCISPLEVAANPAPVECDLDGSAGGMG